MATNDDSYKLLLQAIQGLEVNFEAKFDALKADQT